MNKNLLLIILGAALITLAIFPYVAISTEPVYPSEYGTASLKFVLEFLFSVISLFVGAVLVYSNIAQYEKGIEDNKVSSRIGSQMIIASVCLLLIADLIVFFPDVASKKYLIPIVIVFVPILAYTFMGLGRKHRAAKT